MRDGRRIFWIAATLASIGIAELMFFAGYRGLIYDSYGYFVLAERIVHGGLFAAAFPQRTYAYPLFVAICTGFQTVGPGTARILVFHAQLALLLIFAGAGARMLGQLYRSDAVARAAYAAVVWNPFLLARATETLSDLLAGLLGYLAVFLVFKRDYPARSQSPPAAATASLLLAATAAVIRPAAAALLIAVALLWIARQMIWREFRVAVLPLLIAAAILPFLPQVAINARAYGRAEPLMIDHVYREQLKMGMARLKYATAVPPHDVPGVNYLNPLYRGEKTPFQFVRRPFALLATAAIHLFAALDQDFLFTYVRDFHPAYRWPLSAANFLFLFLGGVGGVLGLQRADRPVARDPRRFAAAALLIAAGFSIAVYLPTAVESRFAVPFELFWTPFFALSLVTAQQWWEQKRWRLLAWLGAAGIAWTLLCLRASQWISAQAPRLK